MDPNLANKATVVAALMILALPRDQHMDALMDATMRSLRATGCLRPGSEEDVKGALACGFGTLLAMAALVQGGKRGLDAMLGASGDPQ